MRHAGKWSAEDVRDILVNPVYCGIGPYKPIVDDTTWIQAAKRTIKEEGCEYFLKHMLRTLRSSLACAEPDHGTLSDAALEAVVDNTKLALGLLMRVGVRPRETQLIQPIRPPGRLIKEGDVP